VPCLSAPRPVDSGPKAAPLSTGTTIPLGPFELSSLLGRGGMGEVWSGVHPASGQRVAVKVLTRKFARDPWYLESFRTEVRSSAGLDHPNVVPVLDYGEVPPEAADANPRLVAGSPWLAMELVAGGSLSQHKGQLDWRVLRRVLVQLLDALAHAHARGVIHRDLKPGNVLLDGMTGGVRLTDFGLAHFTGDSPFHDEGEAVGTPAYMAPEQASGRWRDQGPWTDLYAVGCLGFALATGSPPFGSKDPSTTLTAQVYEPPPPLDPANPVPPDFEGWLLQLLAKPIGERFTRAADAAWALMHLEPPEQDDHAPTVQFQAMSREAMLASAALYAAADEDNDDTIALPTRGWAAEQVTEPISRWDEDNDATMPIRLGGRSDPRMPLATRPPPAKEWRRPRLDRSPALLGAGLNLYGLRSIPLVGREKERDRLWKALGEVDREGQARVVTLEGAQGVGKSRLAQWLCERAHEVGAATFEHAVHSPIRGSSDGLGPMVARSLVCGGLERSALIERLATCLGAQGVKESQAWHALAELISPGSATIRFGSATEQNEVIKRYLERCARGPAGPTGAARPVVLWLDDVQWGLSTLEFVQYVLETQETAPLPLLVVMTVQASDLAQRRAETLVLDEILALAWAQRIAVGPLPPAQRRELVRELVGLEGRLATRIEERTGGNPLFAVQLVGDWIERGLLVPSEQGFKLRAGARLDLPDSLQQVWGDRVEHLLRACTQAQVLALELAAVLGQEVAGPEWRQACERMGADPDPALIEGLLREQLIRASDEGPQAGFGFVHGMLRETLSLQARDQGRLARLHQVCAEVLADQRGRSVPERRGRHLVAAGQHADALPLLLDGVRARLNQGQIRMGAVLLGELDAALDAAGRPTRCAERGWAWAEWSRLCRLQGDYDDADAHARRAVDCGAHAREDVLQASAFLALGLVNWERGEYERGLRLFRRGEGLSAAGRDRSLQARCRQEAANCFRRLGRLDQAKITFKQAMADFLATNDGVGAAGCLRGLGETARQGQELGEARRLLTQARSAYHREGHRWGEGMCLNALGEVLRYQGDLKRAEQTYRMALERLKAIGSPDESYPRVNLALVHLEKGRYRQARRRLEESLATLKRLDRQPMIGSVHLALLPCLGHFRDWTAWDVHFNNAKQILEETGIKDIDLARLAIKAGDVTLAAGSKARTREVWGFAVEHWEALGQVQEAAALRERLRGLERRGR